MKWNISIKKNGQNILGEEEISEKGKKIFYFILGDMLVFFFSSGQKGFI